MSINPEKNPKVRAVLYVIGCGGIVHLTILLTVAIIKGDRSYFHPFYTIDADQLWPAVRTSTFLYIGGWLGFFLLIYLVYRLLGKRRPE